MTETEIKINKIEIVFFYKENYFTIVFSNKHSLFLFKFHNFSTSD